MGRVLCLSVGVIEYPQLEVIPKDHQIHLLGSTALGLQGWVQISSNLASPGYDVAQINQSLKK